jgi:hypothetical protein
MEEFYVSLGRTIKVYVSPSKKIFGPVPDPSSHFFSQKIENKFSIICEGKTAKTPGKLRAIHELSSQLRSFAASQLISQCLWTEPEFARDQRDSL